METMKKPVDLDFSEISGGKKEEPKDPPVITSTPEPIKIKRLGILLTIPTEDKKTFLSKDISECTVEEFLTWTEFVYPLKLRLELDKHGNPIFNESSLRSTSSKLRVFESILEYHQNALNLDPKRQAKVPC